MPAHLNHKRSIDPTRFDSRPRIYEGRSKNVPAPEIVRHYWNLPDSATLRDVVLVVRADEAHLRDVNHGLANELGGLPVAKSKFAPSPFHESGIRIAA